MRYMTTIALSLALFLFVAIADAADVWSSYNTIKLVTVSDNALDIWFTNDSSDVNNIYNVYTSDQNYKVKSTLVMSAFYSGHDIKIKYDNSGSRPARAIMLRVRR